jgi:membrane associated rhomboid family serine protease
MAEGVFWRCPECEGRLLGVAVARKFLDRRLVSRLWLDSADPRLPKPRECPLCRNQMTEAATSPGATPVHLDICRRCQYLWFDTHELAHLAEAAPVRPEDIPASIREKKRLPAKAREILAVYEVERIRKQAEEEENRQLGEPPDVWWKVLCSLLGLPVEEDVGPLRNKPWVTWSLAAVMVVVFLATFPRLETVVQGWGLIPAEAWRQHGLTWLTSLFLHGSIWHLLGNLYFFLVFADNIEDYLGRAKFLLLFFLAGFAGDVLHGVFEPLGTLPSIGASGAISGIIAFYALQFPKARLCVCLSFKFYFHWIRMPAWGAFVLWCGLQVLIAFQQLNGIGNVSGLAHAGGAATGLLFWMAQRFGTKTSSSVA